MTRTITEIVGGEPYEFSPLGQYVVRAKGVCGGRPTFKYTRIEVARVLAMLSSDTIETIVRDYKGRISREAIEEAIQIQEKSGKKQRNKALGSTAAA